DDDDDEDKDYEEGFITLLKEKAKSYLFLGGIALFVLSSLVVIFGKVGGSATGFDTMLHVLRLVPVLTYAAGFILGAGTLMSSGLPYTKVPALPFIKLGALTAVGAAILLCAYNFTGELNAVRTINLAITLIILGLNVWACAEVIKIADILYYVLRGDDYTGALNGNLPKIIFGIAVLDFVSFFVLIGDAGVADWFTILRIGGSVLMALVYMDFVKKLEDSGA
ncbi:MAG: hypothetical protein FWE60_04410, partial [Oscillospiraceae bacterium]|nr:hypothetical protein [Oscillospiraceae bacterium]